MSPRKIRLGFTDKTSPCHPPVDPLPGDLQPDITNIHRPGFGIRSKTVEPELSSTTGAPTLRTATTKASASGRVGIAGFATSSSDDTGRPTRFADRLRHTYRYFTYELTLPRTTPWDCPSSTLLPSSYHSLPTLVEEDIKQTTRQSCPRTVHVEYR
jgi:hypothetical protein